MALATGAVAWGQDAYVRLLPSPLPLFISPVPSRRRPVVFVDVDLAGQSEESAVRLLARLREVPHEVFADALAIIVRAPDITQLGADQRLSGVQSALLDGLVELNDALQLGAHHCGVAAFAVPDQRFERGVDTAVRIDVAWNAVPPDERDLLARARRAELDALIWRGDAVWRPTGYHYRLPSGRHATTFVRLADIFREPRDAVSLATWVAAELPPRAGLLTDSASLSPLVLAVRTMQRQAGVESGRNVALANYPHTQFDINRAVRDATGLGSALHTLLSVSSSGDVLDRLVRAGADFAPYRWQVDVLVARSRQAPLISGPDLDAPVIPPARPAQTISVWTSVEDAAALASAECPACRDTSRARLVQIDPRSFEGLVLPSPRTVVPLPSDARRNYRLWEMCDASCSALVQADPDPEVVGIRPKSTENSSRMGMKIDWTRLLTAEDLVDEVTRAVESLRADFLSDAGLPVDVLVVDQRDAQRAGADALIQGVAKTLGEQCQVAEVDSQADATGWGGAAKARIASGRHIVLFTLGVVSGYTLQRTLVGVQELLRSADPRYVVRGLVVHGRPTTSRQWDTLNNSFNGRLHFVWRTLLPDWSPFDDEAVLLDDVRDSADDDVRQFIEQRREICAGRWTSETAQHFPTLWGLPSADAMRGTLRRQSLFGDRLGSEAVHVAVASAVHAARDPGRAAGAPEWRVFDMPAIFRSYYDPLLVASFLRWLRPGELWWGTDEDASARVIDELLNRAHQDDLKVLLPELLLACAAGKVAGDAPTSVVTSAEAVLARRTAPWSSEELTPLRAALHVWRSVTGLARDFSPPARPVSTLGPGVADSVLAALTPVRGVTAALAALPERWNADQKLEFLVSPHDELGNSPLAHLSKAEDPAALTVVATIARALRKAAPG